MTWCGFKECTISNKVFVYSVVIVVVSVVSVASWVVYKYDKITRAEMQRYAQSELSAAVDSLKLAVMVDNQEGIENIIATIMRAAPELNEVKVFSPSNEIVYQILRPGVANVTEKFSAPMYSDYYGGDSDWLDPRESITEHNDEKELLARLDLTFNFDSLDASYQQLLFETASISMLVIIFAAIVGYFFSTTITRPIRALSDAAKRVRDGDLKTHVVIKSSDELGALALTFGSMVDALCVATEDIKSSNIKLKQSNEDLDRFSYVVSHDLGAPLRRIKDFCRILNRTIESKSDDKEKMLLQRISMAAESGIEMIDGLLEFSRVKTRAKPFTHLDLQDVVATVCDEIDMDLKALKGEVIVGRLPWIDADPVQIKQLFHNLIGNAVKYHKEGVPPLIKIDSTVVSDKVTISIKDNGIGFESSQTEIIFQVFQRLHRDQTKFVGNGVGLAICERIVRRMQGKITAVSTPGNGAEFIVTLPLHQVKEEGDHV